MPSYLTNDYWIYNEAGKVTNQMKTALYGHVCPERGIKQYYNNDMCLKSRDIEHILFKN